MDNRERALHIFAVASLLEARGANPYRVRAYRRAAVRLLRLPTDAAAYLDERGELDLPGLGTRLRRKLGELVRTDRLSFHDELLAALPRPVRTLMTVPGVGPKTAERLVGELHVRGLKSLARAARQGRLQQLRGIGPVREQRWGEAATLMLAPPAALPESDAAASPATAMAPATAVDAAGSAGTEPAAVQLGMPLTPAAPAPAGHSPAAPRPDLADARPTPAPDRAA